MEIKYLILIILFILSGISYYQITGNATKQQTFKVTRVIDGDTVVLENGQRLRLLGINTPEKTMPYHDEAKNFLKNLVENKSIKIESRGTGKYGRTLSYIFINNKNINEEMLRQGLANLFYYDKDKYYKDAKNAEEFARLNEKNLWKKSPDKICIELVKLKTDEPEKLTLRNKCNRQLNITYKDDASHIYRVTLDSNSIYTKEFSHVWNNGGDSIYINDEKGLLIFYRYN